MDWYVSLNEFGPLWRNQPSFILIQLVFIIGGLCTLIHAFSNRGGWPLLWFIVYFNGILLEMICCSNPYADVFWHSQTAVMFFGKRLPFHITLFYPCLFYTASVGAALMKIPRRYEPLAVGVLTLLINQPSDLIGVKFLHFTWHNTDINTTEQNYGIPWTSYPFLFTFSAIIITLYYMNQSTESRNKLLSCSKTGTICALILATPLCILLNSLWYALLRDYCEIPIKIVFFTLFSISLSVLWSVDSTDNAKGVLKDSKGMKYIISYLLLHYFVYSVVAIFDNPESQVSVGFHQPLGPCNVTEINVNILGQELQRDKYVCLDSSIKSPYFDFHCISDFSPSMEEIVPWYTICGTPFENRIEYICVIICVDIVAFIVFKNIFWTRPSERKRRKNM